MAKTAFATGNALTKKLWEEKLFRDVVKQAYFSKFMSESPDNIVTVKRQLEKQKGDAIYIGLRMRLSGAGVNSGEALEGNEEALTTYSMSVSLEEYAHAVRDRGPLDRSRVAFSIDDESVMALKDWGSEKIDKLCFDAIVASPTKIFYGGDATSTATIEEADVITPDLISKVKAAAKTGLNRTYVPIRPIKFEGKDYYILLVHPDVLYDLEKDATFAQARREAELRGKDNPIFSGAYAVWNGVIIHDHENIPLATTWGAGSAFAGAKCVFMGAQALTWAWGMNPEVVAEEFDYKREHGYAWKMIAGVAKSKFNSLDYGSFGVYVARTQISDAA